MEQQTACLSELLEKGMAKMDELHMRQAHLNIVTYDHDANQYLCCAVGAMCLGAGIEFELTPFVRIDTGDALDWIADVCPAINDSVDGYFANDEDNRKATAGSIIWNMNDGTGWFTQPRSLSEILAWLRERGL